MLQVLFLPQSDSKTNRENFVPVLLDAMLSEQPKLGWRQIGKLEYRDMNSAGFEEVASAEIVCSTLYVDELAVPPGKIPKGHTVKSNVQYVKELNSDAIYAIGGPVPEGLAEAALLHTGADFFFAGSGLMSFRRFCEHVDECKARGTEVDREHLQTIPGLYQRIGETIIHPLQDAEKQETRFIRELKISARTLFRYNEHQPEQKMVIPYPMFHLCTQGCSYCRYDPIPVPLTIQQRQDYALEAIRETSRRGWQKPGLEYYGPFFDFEDKGYQEMKRTLGQGFGVMCKPTHLLEAGEVSKRKVSRRILEMIDYGLESVGIGLETFSRGRRRMFGKPDFTNQEILRAVDAMGEAYWQKQGRKSWFRLDLFILPPGIDASIIGMKNEWYSFIKFMMDMKNWFCMYVTNNGAIKVYPDTPEEEILRLVHERFPEEFERYFHRNIAILEGKNSQRILYESSLPLDPILLSTMTSMAQAFKQIEWMSGPEKEMNKGALMNYLGFSFATRYAGMLLGSGIEFPAQIKRMALEIITYAKAVEMLSDKTLMTTGEPREMRALDPIVEDVFERSGRKNAENILMATPLRNHEAYNLWRKLPRMRREMTERRKQGDPNWRKVCLA
ncbi:MAG: hypothetical protein ABII22_02565 [Candidatus Micrarchaeota archaeon]